MRKNLFYMSLLASMAFAFTACSDGDNDDKESLGNENEACMEGNVCNGDLVCVNNVCKAKSGAADGAEGGKCLADNKCNGDLVCDNDVCKAKSSAADGAEGGKCLADNKCNGDLVCDNDVCKAKSGPADGAEGGACKSDGSCDKYLACDANVCKPIDDGKAGGKCGGEVKCDKYLNCNVDVCEAIADGAEGGKCKADNACDGELLCKDDVCVAPGPGDKNQVCREDGYCNGSLVCSPDDSGNAKCVEAAAIVEELVKSDELINKVQICLFPEPVPVTVPVAPEEDGENNAAAKNFMEKLSGLLVDENVVCGNYLNQPILDIFNRLVAVDESTCQQDISLQMKAESVAVPSSDYYSCLKQSDFDLVENFDTLIEIQCARLANWLEQTSEECVNSNKAMVSSMLLSDEAVCASQYNDAIKLRALVENTASMEMMIKEYEYEYNSEGDLKACKEKCQSNDYKCMSDCEDAKSEKEQIASLEATADMYSKLGSLSMSSGVPVDYILCLRDSEVEMSKKVQSWLERDCKKNSYNYDSLEECIENQTKSINAEISTPEFCADEYKDSIVWQKLLMMGSSMGASINMELIDVAYFEFYQWWNDNAEKLSFEEKVIASQRFPFEEITKAMMNLTNNVDSKYRACLNNESDREAVASLVLDQLCDEDGRTVFYELMNYYGFDVGTETCKASIESFLPEETSACSDEMISYIINVFPALVKKDPYNVFSAINTKDFKDMMTCVDNNVKDLFDNQDQYDDAKANYAKIADMNLKDIDVYLGMSVDLEALDYALYFMYEKFLYNSFLLNQRNKEDGCAKAYLDCGMKYGECFVAATNDSEQYECENNMYSCTERISDKIMSNDSCSEVKD